MTVATANVNTLLDYADAKDERLAGRVQVMELQFESAGLDIVAVQESREGGDCIRAGVA